MIFGTLNPEKISHEHITCLSDVATLPWEIQKKSFSTISFIYFRLFTLPQKKTNSNCSTAALAVHLLLFSASYYLHSPITVPEARYRRSAARVLIRTSWGLQQRLVAMWAEFQHTVLFYATDQCRKKTASNSMYECRRWSPWTLAVTQLAWHSSCHTSQMVLFRATDDNIQLALFRASNIWKNATNLQSDEKVLQFTS